MSNSKVPAGFKSIPLLGEIPEGNPVLATEFHLNEITWPADIAAPYDFGYLVTDDFMKDTGIMKADIVFVKYDAAPKNGDTFLYVFNGKAKLGRVHKSGHNFIFTPANSKMTPDEIRSGNKSLRLVGKVTGCWRPDIEA